MPDALLDDDVVRCSCNLRPRLKRAVCICLAPSPGLSGVAYAAVLTRQEEVQSLEATGLRTFASLCVPVFWWEFGFRGGAQDTLQRPAHRLVVSGACEPGCFMSSALGIGAVALLPRLVVAGDLAGTFRS